MYKMFFPDSENDHEDKELYYRFTAYLKKSLIHTRNEYLHELFKTKKMELSTDIEADESVLRIHDMDAEKELENSLIWIAIKQYMSCLNKREKEIINLFYCLDITDENIASVYGCSRPRITYIRHRALKKLNKHIGGMNHGTF